MNPRVYRGPLTAACSVARSGGFASARGVPPCSDDCASGTPSRRSRLGMHGASRLQRRGGADRMAGASLEAHPWS